MVNDEHSAGDSRPGADDTSRPLNATPESDERAWPDRAVIDAIVDGVTARLLVGDDEALWLVPVGSLPPGAGEGDWLTIDVAQAIVSIDAERTSQRRSDLEARLQRLRRDRRPERLERNDG